MINHKQLSDFPTPQMATSWLLADKRPSQRYLHCAEGGLGSDASKGDIMRKIHTNVDIFDYAVPQSWLEALLMICPASTQAGHYIPVDVYCSCCQQIMPTKIKTNPLFHYVWCYDSAIIGHSGGAPYPLTLEGVHFLDIFNFTHVSQCNNITGYKTFEMTADERKFWKTVRVG